MSDEPLDLALVARVFQQHHVDAVLVGGMAVILHGGDNTTQDLDFAICMEDANIERLADALQALNARPKRWRTPNYRLNRADFYVGWIHLISDAGEIDLLAKTPGLTYEELKSKTQQLTLEPEAEVLLATAEALRIMKRTAGRPKDFAHLDTLDQIENSRTEPFFADEEPL